MLACYLLWNTFDSLDFECQLNIHQLESVFCKLNKLEKFCCENILICANLFGLPKEHVPSYMQIYLIFSHRLHGEISGEGITAKDYEQMANFVSFNCTNCTGYEANNNSCFVHWKVQFYVGKSLDICGMKSFIEN